MMTTRMTQTRHTRLTVALFAALAVCAMAQGAGTRMSVTVRVVSVDPSAKQIVCRGKIDGKAQTVTVVLPDERMIYYRWSGSAEDMRDGDVAEVSGTAAKGTTTISEPRISLFKGKKRRGGDFAKYYSNDRIATRGTLRKQGENWGLMVEGKAFVVQLDDGAQFLICHDAAIDDIRPDAVVSLSGRLVGDRIGSVSQLYIRGEKPGYDPDAPKTGARGGYRTFTGTVRRYDPELRILVGSGELDGEVVPLSVRWPKGNPPVHGEGEKIEPGMPFRATGFIPDNGRWLMENPDELIVGGDEA